jgi:hypothetical protein
MSRAKEREPSIAKRAERAVAKAARSLAEANERKAAKAERKRRRDWSRTTRHANSVELARDEAARLRGFTTG